MKKLGSLILLSCLVLPFVAATLPGTPSAKPKKMSWQELGTVAGMADCVKASSPVSCGGATASTCATVPGDPNTCDTSSKRVTPIIANMTNQCSVNDDAYDCTPSTYNYCSMWMEAPCLQSHRQELVNGNIKLIKNGCKLGSLTTTDDAVTTQYATNSVRFWPCQDGNPTPGPVF